MIDLNRKMHIDIKNGDWRTVVLRDDNTILKVINTGCEKEAIAQRVADDWNSRKGFK